MMCSFDKFLVLAKERVIRPRLQQVKFYRMSVYYKF